MEKFIVHVYTFILPLFIGNLLHMLIVKFNLFSGIAKPLSIAKFGAGKTYRAFVVMPLTCGFSSLFFRTAILHEPNYFWSFAVGFNLGFVYLAAELPNSFLKRSLGISSGQSHAKYRNIQYIVDKTDSLVPACIVYYFIAAITVKMVFLLFAVSFFIHVAFSLLLFKIKIKKSF